MFGFIKTLATTFDIPGFNWKGLILGFTTAQFIFENYLTYRQYKVLQKSEPPETLKLDIPKETFSKSQLYSRAKARFSIFSDSYSFLLNYTVIQFNVLPKLWGISAKLMNSDITKFILPKFMGGVITQSLFFLFSFQFISSLISIPISYYEHFVLEEKFGFNKQTKALFFTDIIKSLILGVIIGSPLIAGFLKIIDYFGDKFIFYIWSFLFVVQLAMQTLYPFIIQPFFNKLTPLEEGKLRTSIEELAKKQKFPLTKLYVIDGSKRSSHSNAYFMGLPWSKQIVLFDTLIESSSVEETTAVLGHEIGHWYLSHNNKMIGIAQLYSFFLFTLFQIFIHNNSLYNNFGFLNKPYPVIIGFLLFNDILKPLDCFLTFGMNLLSRKHEYQADAYAVKLGYSQQLSRALIKLQIENLSTMDADFLYSSYHYSHPILSERLKAIGYVADEKVKKTI
ncbi:zinc metalloprotease [Ascoidea rubescens DSM 1968]|uniref:CAAX prenyl protease n=1 Tax=Ascoidea rubescens DSM 1968 TaxID=1344418 RepID=A0A1D2VRD6_9ASCO|nr:CAAX prenyl protease 1 [Ascoidea rubescens DSM 1968]ODV64176.1 CAAX prenyl protease 1 [Ascoidea rubescens DSM 1968]